MTRKRSAEPVFTRQFSAYGDTEDVARAAMDRRLGEAGFKPYNQAPEQFAAYLEDGPMRASGQFKMEMKFTPSDTPAAAPKEDAVQRRPSSYAPTDVFGVTRSEF